MRKTRLLPDDDDDEDVVGSFSQLVAPYREIDQHEWLQRYGSRYAIASVPPKSRRQHQCWRVNEHVPFRESP